MSPGEAAATVLGATGRGAVAEAVTWIANGLTLTPDMGAKGVSSQKVPAEPEPHTRPVDRPERRGDDDLDEVRGAAAAPGLGRNQITRVSR